MDKKVRKAIGIYKFNTTGIVYTKDGKIIKDYKKRIEVWKEYITDLSEDNRPEHPPELNCPDSLSITIDKVKTQYQNSKMANLLALNIHEFLNK